MIRYNPIKAFPSLVFIPAITGFLSLVFAILSYVRDDTAFTALYLLTLFLSVQTAALLFGLGMLAFAAQEYKG